jgi:hypothetical protein
VNISLISNRLFSLVFLVLMGENKNMSEKKKGGMFDFSFKNSIR